MLFYNIFTITVLGYLWQLEQPSPLVFAQARRSLRVVAPRGLAAARRAEQLVEAVVDSRWVACAVLHLNTLLDGRARALELLLKEKGYPRERSRACHARFLQCFAITN